MSAETLDITLPKILMFQSISISFDILLFVILCLAISILLVIVLLYDLPKKQIQIWPHVTTIIDFGLFLFGLFFLISYITGLSQSLVLSSAIILSFFLPGYSILRFINYKTRISILEWPILSFVTSSAITPLVLLLQIWLVEISIELTLLGIVLICMLAPIRGLIDWKNKRNVPIIELEIDTGRLLILLSITILFTYTITNFYPLMTGLFGLDIVRHYSSSLVLLGAPDQYTSIYPWFHALWAIPHLLAQPTASELLTSLAYLSIFFILSFYIMVRTYLEDFNPKTASVAVVLFVLTSGLGFVLIITQFSFSPTSSFLQIASSLNDLSYWDIGYGQATWFWFWYRPMTHAFTLVFVLLFLTKTSHLGTHRHILLYGILTMSLGFIHLSELVVLELILLGLALVLGNSNDMRIRDSTIGAFFGLCLYLVGSLVLSTAGVVIQLSLTISLMVTLAVGIVAVLFSMRPRTSFLRTLFLRISMRRHVLASILLSLYFGCILAWLIYPPGFHSTDVAEVYFVPMMLFPVLLGIPGILALLFLRESNIDQGRKLLTFVIIGIVVLILGRTISFLNLTYELGYGERRFIPLLFSVCCIFASVYFTSWIQKRRRRISTGVIVLILICGFASTTLTFSYWSVRLPNNPINSDQGVIAFLSDQNNRGFDSPILTLTDLSRRGAEYIPTSYLIDRYRYPIWESLHPEVPMLLLNDRSYPPAHILMKNEDLNLLMTDYKSSYISRHLPMGTQVTYMDGDALCMQLPPENPPSIESQTVVVKGRSDDYFLAMDVLSLGNYSYTTCDPNDFATIFAAKTVFIVGDNLENWNLLSEILTEAESDSSIKEVVLMSTGDVGPYGSTILSDDSNETIVVNTMVSSHSSIPLPVPVTIPKLEVIGGSEALTWYVGSSGQSPLTIESVNESITIMYVNLSPLIHAFDISSCIPTLESVLHLRACNIEDDILPDLSKYENNGTITDLSEVDSLLGSVLEFQEFGNIRVNSSESLNITGPLTIETWVQPNAPEEGFVILSKKASYSSVDGYSFLYDGQSFYFNFGNGTHSFAKSVNFNSMISGGWYHFCVSYNLSSITFYVNGQQIGSLNETAIIGTNSLPILIGIRQDGFWQFNGLFSQLKLYDYSLTNQQVESNYKNELRSNWVKDDLADPLGKIIELLGLDLPSHTENVEWVYSGNTGFLERASFSGDILIHASNIISCGLVSGNSVTLSSSDSVTSYEQVRELKFNGMGQFMIECQNVSIYPGTGFYSRITLVNPEIDFSLGSIDIQIIMEGSNATVSANNFSLSIDGEIDLLARVPISFEIDGRGSLSRFFSLFDSYSKLRCNGHNLYVDGHSSFNLVASDTYTFLTQIDIQGETERSPSLLRWDEMSSMVFIFELTLPILLIVLIWPYLPRIKKHIKRRSHVGS